MILKLVLHEFIPYTILNEVRCKFVQNQSDYEVSRLCFYYVYGDRHQKYWLASF